MIHTDMLFKGELHIENAIFCYKVKVVKQKYSPPKLTPLHHHTLESSKNRKNNNQESENKWNIITNYQEETIINFTKWMEESIFE